MGTSNAKVIERIMFILDKYSLDTYNKGIDELEAYIVTQKVSFRKNEILNLLLEMYENLSEKYKEEIVGEIMNKIHGFCAPGQEIEWPEHSQNPK